MTELEKWENCLRLVARKVKSLKETSIIEKMKNRRRRKDERLGIPSDGSKFWHVSSRGDVNSLHYDRTAHKRLIETGNYFLTREDAIEELHSRFAYMSLRRLGMLSNKEVYEKSREVLPSIEYNRRSGVVRTYRNTLVGGCCFINDKCRDYVFEHRLHLVYIYLKIKV